MKKILLLIILSGFCGCADETEFSWRFREYENDGCSDCPLVSVSIPEAADSSDLALAINRGIQEEVIAILDYDDGVEAKNIQEASVSFGLAFQELKIQFPDEQMDWEAQIVGEISYEDDRLISLKINNYTFTGGAHGFSFLRFLNFDKLAGIERNAVDFFIDQAGLTKLAEIEFRKIYNLPASSGINDTGFMFEGDMFYLPENIGFSDQGVELIYNTYEVASYADGVIHIPLSWSQINEFLKPEFSRSTKQKSTN
jgi:hypothetical protein